MKLNVSLLFLLVFMMGAEALSVDLGCASSKTYCIEEFINTADQSSSIEDLILKLPTHVKQNMTLKRGNNIDKIRVGRLGPHGHKVSRFNSGSATPSQPRVFVWDQKSGFSATWNSGNPEHRASDRVDIYHFDFDKNEHQLSAWFPPGQGSPSQHVDAHFVDSKGRTCTKCHGEVQRPIFPMYPDWPQFYGEFNDEMAGYNGTSALRSDLKTMANEFQPKERSFYEDFMDGEASTNPRYTPLYDVQPNIPNAYYPFRPRTTVRPFSDTSRAFFHRPNLRVGVLFNRLTALQTFEKIKKSPMFKKFPDVMFYSMLDCNWDFVDELGQQGRKDILGPVLEATQDSPGLAGINLRGAAFKASEIPSAERSSYYKVQENGGTLYYKHKSYTEKYYRQIPYEDLLKLLGLKIEDMDIRFRHDSSHKVAKGYNVYDSRAFYNTDTVMDIGYIEDTYAANPICETRNRPPACNFSYDGTYMEGMSYFNSYFDGSATMSELLAARMLIYLTGQENFSEDSELREVSQLMKEAIPNPQLYFETLGKKYGSNYYANRLVLDKTFFKKMDDLSPWIQLPYPPDVLNIQNREGFWGTGAKTTKIRNRHAQWTSLNKRKNRVKNQGSNLCWKVYNVMHKRYRN